MKQGLFQTLILIIQVCRPPTLDLWSSSSTTQDKLKSSPTDPLQLCVGLCSGEAGLGRLEAGEEWVGPLQCSAFLFRGT